MSIRASAPKRTPRLQAQYRAFEAVLRASSALERDFAELLKAQDLSVTQYNVLRILRGGDEAGLSCGEVGGRLIRHDPDVTRLLDRLEKRRLIARVRDAEDRRVVRTRITPEGLSLLASLDEPVDAIHERRFGHLSEAKLKLLKELIDQAVAID